MITLVAGMLVLHELGLSIAPLLAKAIHEVFEDGSVTSMFEGAA